MERLSSIIIVDTSVAIKWFIPETDTDKAVKLRDRYIEGTINLMAPDILLYEVANVLRYHPTLQTAQLVDFLKALFDLNLDIIIPSSQLLLKTAKNAKDLNITVYDSVYLTLAEEIAGHMVTADEKLHTKVKATGLSRLVEHYEVEWVVG